MVGACVGAWVGTCVGIGVGARVGAGVGHAAKPQRCVSTKSVHNDDDDVRVRDCAPPPPQLTVH